MQLSEFEWQDFALCRGLDRQLFFEDYEDNIETRRAVDAMCNLCPVKDLCYQTGEAGEVGVWGGVYWDGNGQPHEEYNSHRD